MKQGNRKFLGFVITIIFFTAILFYAISKANSFVCDANFVFQSAMAYGVVSGLFFGSNVLEHYANKNKGIDNG